MRSSALPASFRPSRRAAGGAVVLLIALGPVAWAAPPGAAAPEAVPVPTRAEPAALVRWRGGSLDAERIRTLADPRGEALDQGGERLAQAALKATFVAIYSARAEAAGLAADPGVAAALETARRRVLAHRYESRRAPGRDPAALPAERVAAAYARDRAARYEPAPQLDVEVLFVRCELSVGAREACRARMAELSRRLADGEPFEALVAEERERSGEANGRFPEASARALDPRLADAATGLAPGEISAPVETLAGLARLRLHGRVARPPIPLAKVETQIRRELLAEDAAAWRHGEATRLAGRLVSPEVSEEELEAAFARAAVAEGLDREPEVAAELERRRLWVLAEEAILRHRELLAATPLSAAEIAHAESAGTRYRLIVGTVPTGGALETALAEADRVRRGLGAGRPLGALAGPGLGVETVGPATAAELRRHSPFVAERAVELDPGAWGGPWPVGWTRWPAERREGRRTAAEGALLYLALEQRLVPSKDEVERELLRGLRDRVGGGVGEFLAVLGPVWGVELLLP